MLNFLKTWREYKAFNALPSDDKQIVFYSEGHAYWVHFEPVITHLTGPLQQKICYLTSEKNDPILQTHNPNIKPFYIGEGLVRTLLFKSIQAKLFVLTMPDLETFHLKRSIHPVHYVYLYHSLVSTHMIYRKGAFEHYDTILCAGPHHMTEIRATEKYYGLKAKQLLPHGYGRLDTIYQTNQNLAAVQANSDKIKVLIAPSWGPNNILAEVGEPLISILLAHHYDVTIRPHPHALKTQKSVIDNLIEKFKHVPHFHYEFNVASFESLVASDVLLTDWSGVAFDYAFGLEKPVIFIDVPPKINNPEYQAIQIEPIEKDLRSALGALFSPQALNQIPDFIQAFMRNKTDCIGAIRQLRANYTFHFGDSGVAGAKTLLNLLNSQQNEPFVASVDMKETAC